MQMASGPNRDGNEASPTVCYQLTTARMRWKRGYAGEVIRLIAGEAKLAS